MEFKMYIFQIYTRDCNWEYIYIWKIYVYITQQDEPHKDGI
jgi:hypothetical protein